MNLRALAVAVLLFCLFAHDALALFIAPDQVPVDRLIATATRYLRLHPREAAAHYTLARIHYLAFSQGDRLLYSYGTNDQGQVSVADPDPITDLEQKDKRPTITTKRRQDHAINAFQGFQRAREMAPKEATFALGRASFLGALLAQKANFPDLPSSLQRIDVHDVRAEFAEALNLAATEDAKVKEMPLGGAGSLVSYEAATNLISLAKKGSLTAAEQRLLKRARSIVHRAENLPIGAITPIVFALDPKPSLSDHLAPEVSTDFDLRGYGFREQWPWVKPDLGFLVWDPDNAGHITSARQLFGGYTFEIFWRDGFAALRSLDDDGDGQLTGRELAGLSVWFDRNSDGKSERAEVITVQDLHVAEIATVPTDTDEIHLKHPRGVTFTDGHAVPSWDWVVEPRKDGQMSLSGAATRFACVKAVILIRSAECLSPTEASECRAPVDCHSQLPVCSASFCSSRRALRLRLGCSRSVKRKRIPRGEWSESNLLHFGRILGQAQMHSRGMGS